MIREEGPGLFFRGWSIYFARIVPVFLIYHPLMEQIRWLIGLGYMT